ncbi:HAMP domain-containing histidine kinase [bacterium]|nr:HAMP domain-containing histidine kinase [bacterium]
MIFLKNSSLRFREIFQIALSFFPENYSDLTKNQLDNLSDRFKIDFTIVDSLGKITLTTEKGVNYKEYNSLLNNESINKNLNQSNKDNNLPQKKYNYIISPQKLQMLLFSKNEEFQYSYDPDLRDKNYFIWKKHHNYLVRGSFKESSEFNRYDFFIFFNIVIILFIIYLFQQKEYQIISDKDEHLDESQSSVDDYITSIFQNIDLAVLILEKPDFTIAYYNSKLMDYFQLVGKKGDSYKLAFLDEVLIQQISKITSGNLDVREFEIDEKVYLLSYSEVQNHSFFIFNDITELKQNEIMKRRYIDAISHELKTPLTNILLYSERLEDQLTGQSAIDNQKVYQNGEALKKLINDILHLSKLDSPNMQMNIVKINLRQLFIDIMRELSMLMDKTGVDLELLVKSSDTIFGDKDLLYKALRNLVENGVKYNRPEGIVKIEAIRESDMIQIKIADTGLGIPEKDLKYIFDRFYRVDQSRTKGVGVKDGTGLGLSIVKHVIHLHKGVIHVESKIDIGTTFTIKLPCGE